MPASWQDTLCETRFPTLKAYCFSGRVSGPSVAGRRRECGLLACFRSNQDSRVERCQEKYQMLTVAENPFKFWS
jgi:hypothetical protein